MNNYLLGLAMLVPCVVWFYPGPPWDLFAFWKAKLIVSVGICACPFIPKPAGWAFAFSYMFLLMGFDKDLLWGSPRQYDGLLVWLSYLSIFCLALNNKKQSTIIMDCLLVSVGLVCLVGLLQVCGFDPIDWIFYQGRYVRSSITSTLYNENFVGHFGGMLCPFFAVFALKGKNLKTKLQGTVLFLVVLITTVLAESLLGLITVISVTALLVIMTLKSSRMVLALLAIAIIAVITLSLLEANKRKWSSLNKRSHLWTYIAKDAEFFGHGPGQLAERWNKTAPIHHQIKHFKNLTFPDRAHSLYLGIAHSFGWCGLALYLVFVLEYLFRGLRMAVWRSRAPIYFAVWSLVLGYHIAGLVNDSGVFHSTILWGMWGLGYFIPVEKRL